MSTLFAPSSLSPFSMMIYSFEQYDKKAHSFQMYFLLLCKIRSTSRRRTQFPRFCIFLFVFFLTSRNLHSAVRLDTVGRITDWKFTRRLISYSWKASWVFVQSRRSLRYRILATDWISAWRANEKADRTRKIHLPGYWVSIGLPGKYLGTVSILMLPTTSWQSCESIPLSRS